MTDSRQNSPQIYAWRGEFGNEYIKRNEATDDAIAIRTSMWTRILQSLADDPPRCFVEIGANIGLNLRALHALTSARLIAIEPNANARKKLVQDLVVPKEDIYDGHTASIPLPDNEADFAFTCGVLIHVPPQDLAASCAEISRVTARFILCCEYFSDHPEEITYRGHEGLLFKRDFGDFWMTQHPELELVDYGFFWKRATGLDNLTWWLFRKG